MFSSGFSRGTIHTGRRFASTSKTSTARQLLRQPVFKSIFLTLLFGSVTIDLMRNRKNLEAMETSYKSKISILEDIVSKLKNGESVNIKQELKLANALTKNRYNSVTDIEFDEQLERLMMDLGLGKDKLDIPEVPEMVPHNIEQKVEHNIAAIEPTKGEENGPSVEKHTQRQLFTTEAKQRQTSKFL